MNRAGVRIGVGARFTYEGEVVEVTEMHTAGPGLEVMVADRRGHRVRRLSLAELLMSNRAQLIAPGEGLAPDDQADVAAVVLSAAPEAERRKAIERGAARAADGLPIRMSGECAPGRAPPAVLTRDADHGALFSEGG